MITVENFILAKIGDTDPQGIKFDKDVLEYLASRHGELKAGYYFRKDGRNTLNPYDISHFTSMPEFKDDSLQCTLVIADTPKGRELQEAYNNDELKFQVICDIALVSRDNKASIGGIKHILAINNDMVAKKSE